MHGVLISTFLVFLVLGTRWFWFVGVGTDDAASYILAARYVAENGALPFFQLCDQIAARLGMVLPLALLVSFFGISELSFSLIPIIGSVLTSLFLYWSALWLWGRYAALLAWALWICSPLQLVYDTQLSPSNLHAMCVSGALFFYLLAERRRALPFRARTALVLAGVLLGFGTWVNELFVVIICAAPPLLIAFRPRITSLGWVLIGALLIIGIELIVMKLTTGSFFYRLSCIQLTEQSITSNRDPLYYPQALFLLTTPSADSTLGYFGLVFYVFTAATIVALVTKDRLVGAFAGATWLVLAYLQWGVISFDGTPITKYIRYLSMIVPVQCLTLAGAATRMRTPLGALAIAIFLSHLLWIGNTAVEASRLRLAGVREIAKILGEPSREDVPIYADDLTRVYLDTFTKGALNLRPLTPLVERNEPPENGIVVLNALPFLYEPKHRDYPRVPKWFANPPRSWKLIRTIHLEGIDRFSQEYEAKIYEIG